MCAHKGFRLNEAAGCAYTYRGAAECEYVRGIALRSAHVEGRVYRKWLNMCTSRETAECACVEGSAHRCGMRVTCMNESCHVQE